MKAISKKTEYYEGYDVTWLEDKEYPCEISNEGTDEETIIIWYEPHHKFMYQKPALEMAREQFEFIKEE